MAEWSIAAVLKTVVPLRGPWVRILLPPPFLATECPMRARLLAFVDWLHSLQFPSESEKRPLYLCGFCADGRSRFDQKSRSMGEYAYNFCAEIVPMNPKRSAQFCRILMQIKISLTLNVKPHRCTVIGEISETIHLSLKNEERCVPAIEMTKIAENLQTSLYPRRVLSDSTA